MSEKAKFDLEKALNGAKVVTRDGHRVTDLKHFPQIDNGSDFCVAGLVHFGNRPTLYTWSVDGRFLGVSKSARDLFLDEPRPRKVTLCFLVQRRHSGADYKVRCPYVLERTPGRSDWANTPYDVVVTAEVDVDENGRIITGLEKVNQHE